jgi:NAD(P)H-hydrate epimerase
VVLLKGPNTVVGSPGAQPVVVQSLAPALATGGSGDVLTGICTALACHLELQDAGSVAAWLHGRSAEKWVGRRADRGLLAHEVAEGLPDVIAASMG